MKTKLFQEGEKSRAICDHCRAMVATTFCRRDVPFESGNGWARNILVAVCDQCGEVVATPAQSTPAIQAARGRATHSIEAQLPAIYLDMLDLSAYAVDPRSTVEFRKVLVALYLRRYAARSNPSPELHHALTEGEKVCGGSRGGARRRLSLKVTEPIVQDLKSLAHECGLSRTDVIKSLIFRIKVDVLDTPDAQRVQEMKTLALVVG
jgi:hypothetical protein